jgi:hypothetical protein
MLAAGRSPSGANEQILLKGLWELGWPVGAALNSAASAAHGAIIEPGF